VIIAFVEEEIHNHQSTSHIFSVFCSLSFSYNTVENNITIIIIINLRVNWIIDWDDDDPVQTKLLCLHFALAFINTHTHTNANIINIYV